MDYETSRASSASYAIFGRTMKVMLENPRAAHKVAFRSLAKMTFDIASKKDFSNQVLAKILQASLASLMLG